MLLEAVLLYFLTNFAVSKPQDFPTDRPQPNRPFYRPNPTYELISQLIPPGKPWPASAVDYESFSQTKPPNYTPLWATKPTAAPITTTTKNPPALTTVNVLKPCPSLSPPVNLEDRFKETERPVEYGWIWPEEQEVTRKKRRSANTLSNSVKESGMLFTSAPAVLYVRIDDDEPKLENVVPVNLLP